MEHEEELAILRAEREITRVILSYARGVDSHDWERVRSCFHPDARIRYGDYFSGDRLGILLGSLMSALLGYLVLQFSLPRAVQEPRARSPG